MFRQTAKPSVDLLCLPETVSAGDLPYLHRREVVLRLLCRGVGGGPGGPAEEVQCPAAPKDEASPRPRLGQPALSGARLSHPRWCLFYNPALLESWIFWKWLSPRPFPSAPLSRGPEAWRACLRVTCSTLNSTALFRAHPSPQSWNKSQSVETPSP